MKKKIFWMIAAILVLCGSVSVMIACEKANAQENNAPAVKSEELIRTSQSWDGVE